MKRILLAALLTGIVPSFLSAAESGSGLQITKDAQAVSYTQTIDVGGLERFSMQVDYTAVRPATSTIAAGTPSTAEFTVADYAGLNGAEASVTITLVSGKNTSAIDGAVIRINGHTFTEGVDWNRLAISTMTMASLKSAIDAWNTEYSASVSSNIVTVTAADIGTPANSWTITTSTGVLSLSGATFSGGQTPGFISINGTTLTEGTDFNAETSSNTTAQNISDAINANATLALIVSSSKTATGVFTITSLTNNPNQYPLVVSDAADLVTTVPYMGGGVTSDISVSGDTFYEPSHGFSTGLSVLFSTTSNSTAPTGLTRETTYYVIPVDVNYYKLATSSTAAVAGTVVDITALPTSGSYQFKPLAFAAGPAAFKWQASNDGVDYTDISGTSVSYSADGTSLYSGVAYPYRYIRFNLTGPTSGGLDVDVTEFWRRE